MVVKIIAFSKLFGVHIVPAATPVGQRRGIAALASGLWGYDDDESSNVEQNEQKTKK